MKTALLQLNVGDNPAENLIGTMALVQQARDAGAGFVLTPEVTNCVSSSRSHQQSVLQHENDDQTLAALRAQAADLEIWLLVGSLALKTTDADGRFANRSFLIDPKGQVMARYDKIHMFDVEVSATETYRESAGYRPGTKAVLADVPFGKIGMTVCYDVRFAQLYQALALAGADILTVPSAFSPVTGAAHWESLLRARAIENGCYVLAPAQTGLHAASTGKPRRTHGHSLVVSPWGEIIADGGVEPGVIVFDYDRQQVTDARRRIMSLSHIRSFDGP